MIKTGERNNRGCYGNTCCTILFLAFYWYMIARQPDREFTDILLYCQLRIRRLKG